jgi:addiction module RelB/DinJ family antitoxin
MAQVNARVDDEDKEKAEKVLKAHDLSVSGYFASVIEYIADTGAIPFEIKQKPKLVNLDEVYAEAVNKFSDLYNGLVSLKGSMQPGIEDQMVRCRPVCNDHSLAIDFLRDNERYVYGAPCQVEKVDIGDGQILDCSRSREIFDVAKSRLAEALRCANFNNRPLSQADLDEMAGALSDADAKLKSLHTMVPEKQSVESLVAFFVMSAMDTVHAARALTEGPFDHWAFSRWFSRLDAGCRDAQSCQKRIVASKWNAQIQKVVDQLVKVRGEVDHWNQERLTHASQNDLKWLSFRGNTIDVADELVRTLKRSTVR